MTLRELPYGRGSVPLEGKFGTADPLVPLGAQETPGAPAAGDAVRQAQDAIAGLARAAGAGAGGARRRVLVSVPDTTRYAAAERILPWLLADLERCGLGPDDVQIRFALGIHRRLTRAEQVGILGPEVAARVAFADHEADGPFEQLGATARGTPIEVNPALRDADAVILLGAASFHYFAGFGGGRKLLIPGLSSPRACRANHLLVLDPEGSGRHPGVGPGRLDGNPVHEDMMEALAAVERRVPVFCLTAVLDTRRQLIGLTAGDARASFREACKLYRERFSCTLAARRPVVVVSCGGHPRDINFIQAHKTLEYAQAALEPGGTMVVLAECPEGAGHPDFLPWFAHGEVAAIERALRADYRIYGQTAWATAWKAARADILLLSALPPDIVARMGLRPVASLAEAEAFVRRKHGGDAPAYVIPYGASTLPQVSGSRFQVPGPGS